MSIISKKNGDSYLYFKNTSAQKFSVIDSASNELYELPSVAPTENGQVIAVNVNGTSEFVNNTAVNALIADQPLVIPELGSIIISDGITSTGTNFSQDIIVRDYGVIDVYKQLNCNDVINIQSSTAVACTLSAGVDDFTINNGQGSRTVFINSNSYVFDNNIISNENVILNQGKSLTLNNDTDVNNVKLYKVNGANGTFFIDNQTGSKTTFKNASEYVFDNSLNIGDINTSNKIFLNGSQFNGVSAGLLRAVNCNLFKPTTTYNIVWSNLTVEEKALWVPDPTTIEPVQSATGNFWNFSKSVVNANKIGWYIPVDLSGLTFQDLQSFWAVIRFNTTTNISTEGSLYFQITTSPATAPNYFRTRINYSNPATPMNQTGYFYKIYALDTITTNTTANFGKGQEINQTQFKLNPCEVRPDLWSIGFNKLVASPTGDTSEGFTTAPIQSISLQTASNINTFNFDVVSIGYLDKQYNLSFA